MADKKIADLNEATTIADTDVVIVEDNANTKKMTWANLKTAIIGAFSAILGNRTYTEENVVTNGESITDSIDKLDISTQRDVCKLIPSTEQTVANETSVIIQFDQVEIDTNDMADTTNYRIYAKKTGIYLVIGIIFLTNPHTTTGIKGAYLGVNGVNVTANGMNFLSNHGQGNNAIPFNYPISLTAGDYITISVYQSTGKTLSTIIANRTQVSLIQLT